MAIIKIDENFAPVDPLGLLKGGTGFGQPAIKEQPKLEASRAPTPTAGKIDPRDYNDVVNTVIAEAGGEGPEGMAAVASVIKNRAARRNQGLGDVVRAPKQFEGYENPGEGSRRSQQDPKVRGEAERIVNGILDGSLPDPTGGADHFKNDSVDPDWARTMQPVARIGGQTFYNSDADSGERPTPIGLGGKKDDPFLAVDRDAREKAEKSTSAVNPTDFLLTRLRGHSDEHITAMQPQMQERLAAMFQAAPPEIGEGLEIFSGTRTKETQTRLFNDAVKKYGSVAEARKWVAPPEGMYGSKGSEHNHGSASDLSYKGQRLDKAPKAVREWVHQNAAQFGLKFPLSNEAWHVEPMETRGGKAFSGGGSSKPSGKAIEIGADFAPADPLGILSGQENPFGLAQPAQTEQPAVDAAPDAAQPDAVPSPFAQLDAKEPGRYQEMDPAEYDAWHAEWEKNQPGIISDMARMVAGGVVKGVGQVVRGAGALAVSAAAPTITDLINPIFGTDYKPSNPLTVPADWVDNYGKGVQQGVSAATKEAIAGSSPDGDLLKPSTWTLGKNPSLRGYTALGLDVFGSMAPVVAGAIATGGTGGMVLGGLQGGGAAEQTAHEAIDEMAAQPGMLEKQSAYYREQIAAGKTREEAIAATKEAAGASAFIWTLPVSALGGAATAKLMHPATHIAARSNIAGRVAARTGASALEEGVQEATETVATRHGINQGGGTDLNVTDGTFADFLLGALGGGLPGAGGGLLSKREATHSGTDEAPTAEPQPGEPAAPRKGPLARAAEYGQQQNVQKFTVNDGPIGDMGAGPYHGQTVTLAPDQTGVSTNMRRVVLPDGRTTEMGNNLLESRSPRPMPAKNAAPEGAPKAGATVRVDAPGIEPFMGRIEGYSDGEATIIDSSTGEVMQIPVGSLTQIAKSPDEIATEAAPAERPIITQGMRSQIEGMGYTPEAIRKMTPEQADDILKNNKTAVTEETIPAAEPVASERTSELPPESDQIKAASRPQGPPMAGERVIVQAPGIERFSGRIERYEDGENGPEAVVTNEAGTEMQVPLDHLFTTKVTPKQAEQQDLKANPPVEREKVENTPEVRTVGGKQMIMPDPLHAQLFDLGKERITSKRLLGTSQLDMDRTMPAKQGELADKFGVTPEALGAMADDYRYRVERAAKESRSELPVNMHPVNPERLKKSRAERAKSDPLPIDEKAVAAAKAKQELATWWDSELTADERADALKRAGVKRSEKFLWKNHSAAIQKKLAALRPAPVAEAGVTNIGTPAALIDIAAHEAATSPKNDLPEPTQAQKEAGNYALGHVRLGGMDISIENPAGSDRKGVDSNGKAWSVNMKSHYGYFKGTIGRDKDHIDTFVKPGTAELTDASPIFVIDQQSPDGKFDEHKVMTGYATKPEAGSAYRANYAKDWRGMGDITETTLGEFKTWLKEGDTSKPFGEAERKRQASKAPAPSERLPIIPEFENMHDIVLEKNAIAKWVNGLPQTDYEKLAKAYGGPDGLRRALGNDSYPPKLRAEMEAEIASQPEPTAAPLPNGTAPEHAQIGVDDRELGQIVKEFNDAQADMMEGDHPVSNVFQQPKKDEVVRLADKAKVYNKEHGWMTPAEAKEKIAEWKARAGAQGADPAIRSRNSQKVVLSLFDLSGEWSKPWEEAGYQVYRFDIQADPDAGDVNNFSTDFFGDWFGDFDGMDIHAILAACPCTDFAVSGARHFAAKDKDGRTVASVNLVHQTLRTIEYFKPAVWAIENPVGRIENLGGLPRWRLSFDPNHIGDPYTKKTLLWGRFNGDLPIAPVEPTEGSKMHRMYGGRSMATKNARSVTPEGFSYGFFMANNAHDHPAMAVANKYDRLDRNLIAKAIDAGVTPEAIDQAVEDFYYQDLDDDAANQAIRDLLPTTPKDSTPVATSRETDGEVTQRAIQLLVRMVPNGTKQLTDEVARGGTDRELLGVAAKVFGEGGASRDDFMLEVRGATAVVKRDDGTRIELKGKTLANVLRNTFNAPNPDTVDPKPDSTAWGADNKLVSRDRADEIREKLRAKLKGQITSGIDPEILALGTELAAFHIEAGARRFADFARAVAADMGVSVEKVRPFLRAWYNGARDLMEDSGLDIAGTDDAEAVRTALAALKDEGPADGQPRKLDQRSPSALEGIPAEPVQGAEGRRDSRREPAQRGEPDLFGNEPAGGSRVSAGRGVADGQGGISDPASGRPSREATRSVADASDGRSSSQRPSRDADQVGPFGPILHGYEGKWREAALELERRQTGDAIGALHHADVGPIDLVWGHEGTNESNGAGLSKLIAWHPEVLTDLQGFLDRLHVDKDRSTARRIQLSDDIGRAGVRLDFDGTAKTWLLTAYEGTSSRRTQRSSRRLSALWGDRKAASSPPRADQGIPSTENPIKVDASQSIATPAADRQVDYTISDADELGQGGAKSKFRNNVAAIKLLRELEEANRPATRDEQSVLAKWVGWGGLRAAFAREDGSVNKGWEKEAAELKELLTPEEFRAAESSTRNAHYTSPEVVQAMWRIAQRLGFKGGQVLEPSVGAGNFLGLMPGALRDGAMVTGVELDHITGGIARNLYPAANIQAPVGFQEIAIPDGHFDLAIGNPPFGSERLYDKARRNLSKFSIHNFFFAKSVDALRPHGVLAMVVTNSFLDAGDTKARKYISDRADLIGAIRLPNNAFQKNAGTEVTTDIILLQKRPDGVPSKDASWVDLGTFKDKEGRTLPLNDYFVKNPDMMLGDFGAYGTMYRGDEAALVARPGEDLGEQLDKAMNTLPENVMVEPGAPVVHETVVVPDTVEDAQPGSMFLAPDGTVHIRKGDSLGKAQSSVVELPSEKAQERVAGMIRIRDAFARLRRAQIDKNATDEKLNNLRKRLNDVYDAFAKKQGPINSDANKRLFREDPTWPQISALEEGYDKGISATVAKTTGEAARAPSARKAPIFTKRTQEPYSLPTSAVSAKDALATVLADRGRVDLDAMSRLYGKSPDEIVRELGPLVYKTPAGAYETADDYLSGNVKQKLAEAERASQTDADYRRNVAALRDVIPADIEPVDIDVKPGAPWLPANHVADFVDMITDARGGKAFYSKGNAKWVIDAGHPTEAAAAQWGTGRTSVATVLDAAMNGQAITVYDQNRDGTRTVNQAATDAANEKLERVKAEWKKWLWQDGARREQLSRIYNDTFNTDVLRTFDGSHLSFPGKVGDDIISLRPHQKNFVWRTLQSGTALADHVVGAGKTFALIASIMEKRRIGQAKKPMLTVPNHLVGQWAADFIKLYPGAKVLAATKKDFEAENRKRLFARVATGDWDVVIVAHSSFGKIGVSPEFEARFIQEQVDDMEASIKALRAATGEKSRNVAQLSKARDNLVAKLQRLLDSGAKDEGLNFNELGVDALYVDELHEFKNLAFSTSMQRVAGLGNAAGSQKAADMYMKMAIVLERTGSQNVVTATGTPLSNTMAEMYTLQRYLDNKALRDLGIAHFDAWARVFGEVVTDWELSPSGQYKLNSRFAKFVNMPELMQRYLSFADVITNDDIKAQLAAIGKKLPLPKVKGGKPQNVVVERSKDQAGFIGEGKENANGVLEFPKGSLVHRAENLPKKAEKGADNMLKVMSDARKAALDMRLIDPSYPDTLGSKVHVAADNIKRIYDAWGEKKGTQLVFIDLSTPKKAKAKEEAAIRELMRKADAGDEAAQTKLDNMSPDEFEALDSKFSVYDDLREKLIQRGIDPNEIAFIHDANTDAQKEELFGKVRSGRIRVLLGSTPKMGAGTNVQNRLVALHHLDAPWRPSDLEQRDGRGIRQGNELYNEDPENFEIEILRYATKNTLDARQWQTIEGKARFIQQMRKGGIKTREIEDIAGEAANSAEMKAAASGNPLILEEMDLRQKVRRLEGQSAEHDREQHRIVRRTREMADEKQSLTKRMVTAQKDAAIATEAAKHPFSAVVQGETIEKQKEFGAALVAAGRAMLKDKTNVVELGKYAGFDLTMVHDHTVAFTINIDGADLHEVHIKDIEEADALGLAMRVINTVRKLPDVPLGIEERVSEIDKQIPALEKQLGPWAGAEQLAESTQRHREVLDQLKPKAKPAPTAAAEPSMAPDGWGDVEGGPVEKAPLDEAALQEIRDIIKEVSGLSDVAFTQRITLPKGAPGWGSDAPTTAAGYYEPSKDAITIALDSGSARVAFHEAFHRLQRLFLTSKERDVLKAEVGRLRRIVSSALGREAQAANMSQKELEAEAFAIYAAGKATIKPHLTVKGLWDRIAATVRRVRNLLAGRGYQTTEDVFDSARSGKTSRREGSIYYRGMSAAEAASIDDGTYSHRPYQVHMFTTPDRAGAELFVDGGYQSKSNNVLKSFRLKPGLQILSEKQYGRMFDAFKADAKAQRQIATTPDFHSYLRKQGIVGVNGTAISGFKEMRLFDPADADWAKGQGLEYSIAPSIATVTQDKVIDEVRGKLTDIQPKLLKAVPLNYFTELAQPNMAAVGEYLHTKRALDAYRGKKQAEADTIAKRWLKYVRVGIKSNTTKAAELAEMMHSATLAGVDPSKTDDENTAHPAYRALRKQFMALAPAARELFVEVRDAYKRQADELDRILLDNVRKAHEIAQRKAEAEHKEEIERINAARMSPADRKQALEDAERAYVGASTRALWSMKARLTKMRLAFETSRVQEPYFPLARHGRYFVTVRDVDGTVLSFSRRENAADRNRLAKEMREAYPTAKVDVGVMESGSEIRQAMDPRILAEIQTILGGTGLDGATMNTVLDQIWQRYLETMPDLSTRKKFIHRKGTAGFDGDALRAFGSHMFHAAHQMGRLKYGMELQELTNNAADQARKSDNPDAGMTLANEMKNRHDWVMNPTGGAVAQYMSSTAFVWYLAASPASALVNMTQTPMLGIPMLAGRFGSFAKAAAAIAKASLDSARGKGSITNANLTPEEKNAMEVFYDSGMIDKTQAHDLAGVGETGVEYSVWRSKVMGVLSWAFHKTEVWNREVTALAAYRMARAAGQNQTDAINTAHDLTWKTHFDYSNSNRPALMQNDFAKVALVFRTHNINMLYRVTRDVHQAFKGQTAQARREARYQLAGVFGMMSLLGGVTGVMGFNVAMMIAGAIFGDDDDPLGFEQEFRKSVTDILGAELGGVVLNGAPGHYLGVDLTSRIGMPDLWFRSPPRELQGQDEYQYWVMNTLGATVGMGGNMYKGFSLVMDGEVARGIEAAAPKAVKDLMKSYRYATEGVQNIGGDEVIAQENMDAWDFIAQAAGFTPAKVTETYDRNSALKNAERRVLDKRRNLMNAYALAATMHDDEGKKEAIEAIKRFNAVPINKPLAIGPDSLQQSLKVRARNAAKREDGALIANPRLGKMLRERLPARTTD